MKIGEKEINKKVFIIAEIGNNHEGNFELAKEMISKAAKAGVDAVKFQTFIPENLVSNEDKTRLKQLSKFQLSYNQFKDLSLFAEEKSVIFFSTPFDLKSAEFLNSIQPLFKIASGDNNFFPLIDIVAQFKKPMIVSTGVADLDLIKKIYDRIFSIWKNKNSNPGLALLHCVSSYPVPHDQANLSTISFLNKEFPDVAIGYSDHTLGIDAAVSSVFCGAKIIEKHFTIDKNYSDFRDHKLSADFEEMKLLVDQVRKAESMLGEKEIMQQKCERNEYCRPKVNCCGPRYSIGPELKWSHFTWVRPGKGFSPGEENILIGKKVNKNLKIGQIILQSDLI